MKVVEVVQECWGGRAAKAYDKIHNINREKMGVLFHRGGIILDVGTGTGSLALMLAESGYERVIGLDINDDMLSVARGKTFRLSG